MQTNLNIHTMKEAYVVIVNDTISIFLSRRMAEFYLKRKKYDEWKKDWEKGFITTEELNDITRHYGKDYMKLTDYVASLNELEAKMALLELMIQVPSGNILPAED